MGGPTPSITYAVDGPNATPAQGDVLFWDGTKWDNLGPGTAGQALLTGGAGANPSWGSAGVSAHSGLTGLGDDDHTQYALLAPGASARNVVQATGGSVVAAAFRLHASQAGGVNLVEFQSSAGTTWSGVSYSGSLWSTSFFFANPYSNVARLTYSSPYIETQQAGFRANAASAVSIPLTVQLAAAQTANAINVTSSGGAAGDVFKVSYRGDVTMGTANAALSLPAGGSVNFASSGSVKLQGGGTFYVYDGASNVLARFDHAAGGYVSNAGTKRVEWNATGIGFFAATPVAKAAALTAADAGALNTGDAGSDTVIANMRTRIGELETKLQNYGLLT